ncbi:hypothetical protein PAQ31011_03832 [Pandoraea aquatica]|uniref:BIG2 domain-containing protein n=1 Tax=Pandoraea aquatica TaxID=2508290 RepID=A0A5E4XCW8_9BURK|nr:Ig-like domain-containing protein [Pandoraea aquatica]VVE34261.1 hypothetical protein PAQ31011_03832 [Pandoraea aquatica]
MDSRDSLTLETPVPTQDGAALASFTGASASASNPVKVLVELSPPLIDGESNGELDPALVPDGALMRIQPWPDILLDDRVTWYWLGQSEGGQASGTVTVSEIGVIAVTVPRGVIEINANGGDTVTVLYTVSGGIGDNVESEHYAVRVLLLPNGLYAPVVQEAIDGVLDPNDADPTATVTVNPYEGMARDDVLTIRFAAGTANEYVWQVPITNNMVGQPVDRFVPYEVVEGFEGQSITVNYTVTTLAGEKASDDLVIEIRRAALWLKPVVEEAEGLEGDYLPADAYPNGVTMTVLKNDDMQPGDEIEVYWGADDDPQQYHDSVGVVIPMDFSIPIPKAVVDRWINLTVPVYYTIKRGNRVFHSEVLNLRVAFELPAVEAPTVEDAPDGVLKPMDARQGATVNIAYDGMLPTDSIQLNWDGDVSFAPVAGDEGGTVSVVVPPGKVALVVGQTIPVSYTVTRNDTVTESGVLDLTVSAFLPANLPISNIVESKSGVLNLAEFEGDATARLNAWPLMAAGQRLWWRVHGTQTTDRPILFTLESGYAITEAEVGSRVDRVLRRVDIEKLKDGSDLRIEAKVTFDGSSVEAEAVTFRERTLRVSHGLSLPEPVVLDAPEGELDAIDAVDGITVRVSYEDMETSDLIELVLDGRPDFGQVAGDASGTVDIEVPAAEIVPYIGKSVQVFYRVLRRGVYSASGVLSLTVSPFEADELEAPVIPQAANGVLRLTSFTGDAQVDAAPWPGIAAGQRVWLRCYGTLANGQSDVIELALASSVMDDEVTAGLTRALARARLMALQNNSSLRVEMKVAFDGGNDEAQALLFPTLTVQVQQVPEFVISPSPMTLNGLAVNEPSWPWKADAPGNVQTRPASGGVPPYTYQSSRPSVASVNASGRVVGEGNGSATITVTDRAGNSGSYSVTVSNVYKVEWNIHNAPSMTAYEANAWRDSVGGRGLGMVEMELINQTRRIASWGGGSYVTWSCSPGNCGSGKSMTVHDYRHTQIIMYYCVANDYSHMKKAMCLVPKNG